MTITNNTEATVTYNRLQELKSRYIVIEADPAKNDRAKRMELAGIESMMEELRSELQAYQISEIEKSIQGLQAQLLSNQADLQAALSETLNVIERLLKIVRSVEKVN